MNTYEIENFKNQIIDITNQSGLNIGIIYLIFKDLYKEIETLYNQQVLHDYIESQNKALENKETKEE